MTNQAMQGINPAAALEAKLASMGATSGESALTGAERLSSLVRVGSMLESVLENIDQGQLDEEACQRAAFTFGASVGVIRSAVTETVGEELSAIITPIEEHASPQTLRLAYSQISGWLSSVVSSEMARGAAEALSAVMAGETVQVEEKRRSIGYL